ncbi:MAG TPA: SprB repeat-containing protein, partial [Bacteroidia bacterium]
MKRILLPLVLLLAFISGYSADRFWVGGSGNWIDRNHWSEKSGGTAGASIPTAKDDVIFDSQSFLSEGEAVTIETAASFHNMNWKGVSHSPILVGPSAAVINIYGSLALDEKMQNQFKGKIFFKSFLPGNTIFSANHFFLGDLVFDNVNSEWKFLDDIRTINNASIIISGGILSTNDRNVNCYSVISYGNKKRGLQLGASQIVIRGQWNFSNTVNLTFNKGTSEIILSKEKSAKTFLPGNLSYNKLAITNANCNPSGDGCAFFTITLTMTQVTCAGSCNGTTSASIAGGTGPFTYQWDDPAGQTTQTATGLCIGTRLVQVTDGLGNTCVCSISVTSPPTLNTQPLTETPATCNGTCNATVSVIALGGVTPYTYLWSPTSQTTTTATGLCGTTTYTLTLSDANHCTITRTKLVTEPAALVTGGTSTSLTCYNVCTGTASVNPSGGTAPYTYVWAPGGATTTARTSLCAGNYTCTIKDANGCTNNYTTTISQPTQLTATVSGTNLNCNSDQTGTVNATASGGTG